MAESDMMEYALLAQEASDFGASFCYGSLKGAPCSSGSIGFGGRLTSGGFSPHAETIIVIRKSVFTTAPNFNEGQPLSVTNRNGDTRKLMIAKDGIMDLVYAWQLTLSDSNQNA